MAIFGKENFSARLETYKTRIRDLYASDETPWIIGYSGGKDSTATVQLAWLALRELSPEKRTKPVYVITTDTLVENPIVSAWVTRSLEVMSETAKAEGMPFVTHLLKPDIANSFWVNLIGRGYPAPRPKFRWCTERLKIKPSSRFIESVANKHNEVILLLGVRRGESIARSQAFERREQSATHEALSHHPDLLNTLVFTPIEDWTSDDVWMFLLREKNPWGYNNKDLMAMYRGASEDNECPVVVDTSTPSCGSSRFGCWTCTLVEQDKSMSAMIQNDKEKEWMLPLLKIRNELDFRTESARALEKERRDFRRMGGHLQYYHEKNGDIQLIRGPYTQKARAHWLKRLLETQKKIHNDSSAPAHIKLWKLISIEELEEIRRIWLVDKHEVEDLVPKIYAQVLGEEYPGTQSSSSDLFDDSILELLKIACDGNVVRYETARNLLAIEQKYQKMGARRGLFTDLEQTVKSGCFETEQEALEFKKKEARISKVTTDEFAERLDPSAN